MGGVAHSEVELGLLKAEVEACRKCALSSGRLRVVFGAGTTSARVMLVGEAPGKQEDLQGEPFVGAAGKSLNELLGLAGLVRSDIYIANVLKCRPPKNRNPSTAEISCCAPYLEAQIRLLNPEFVVTLGNFATRFMLKTKQGITDVHGKIFPMGTCKVFPVFHPAATLYDRSKLALLQTDFTTLGHILRAT